MANIRKTRTKEGTVATNDRIEKLEEDLDSLKNKFEILQESNFESQKQLGVMNEKLSQLNTSVSELVSMAKDAIKTSTHVDTIKDNIVDLYKKNEQTVNSIDNKIKDAVANEVAIITNNINTVSKAISKRDAVFISTASTIFVTMLGFIVWFIQKIGDKVWLQ